MTEALHGNLRDLLRDAIGHHEGMPALILADSRSILSRLLTEGYRAVRPGAAFLDVDATEPPAVFAAIDALPRGALVVLLESTRFELAEFRFRLELFKRGLAVVEHPHLGRVGDDELVVYIDALAHDPAWLGHTGRALKARIDGASSIQVRTAAGEARWRGPFEPARLNIGDYAGMPNVGGQFPIGEVFTEAVDLQGLDGTVSIGAFGASDFSVAFPPPFALEVVAGRVVASPGAPAAFAEILASISAVEGEVWLRELGFGLNRAMTETRRLSDVGAYERMCGVHLSLGAKHSVYPKAGFSKRQVRFHVDVFCAAPTVLIDQVPVYAGGEWAP